MTLQVFQTPVWAEEAFWPEEIEVEAPSYIVMEVNTGTVLYEKNADEVHYPASITKILTTLLALENCSMDEVVTFSADAVFKNEGNTSHIARDLNEEMTMEECLYAVMLESANECAWAVAEHVGARIGGSYQAFIDRMNQKAAELGCTNSQFHNPNGLPDEEHWTSARDMAKISAAAYKNEAFRQITGTLAYDIPPTNKHKDVTYLRNHHAMISKRKTEEYIYPGCTGGKTGYTDAAGSTLVTYVERDGLTLVCVVMNARANGHYTSTIALFNEAFAKFETTTIEGLPEGLQAEQKYRGFMNESPLLAEADRNATLIIPRGADLSKITYEMLNEKMVYRYAGREIGTIGLLWKEAEAPQDIFLESRSRPPEEMKKVVVIPPIYLILAGSGALVVIVLIVVLIWRFANRHKIRHDRELKRERRQRFQEREISVFKKENKRNRLFK